MLRALAQHAYAVVLKLEHMLASVSFFRHGQRAPFPAYGDSLARGHTIWSPHRLPSLAEWNMSAGAFDALALTPRGHVYMRHEGEYRRHASPFADPCAVPKLFIADNSQRTIESARAFIEGYSRGCDEVPPITVADDASEAVLRALASDDYLDPSCPAADHHAVNLEFGADTQALTDAYRDEIRKVGSVLECCSAYACGLFGLKRACTLDELPYKYNALYWKGFYDGPLEIAATFVEMWQMQALASLREIAWGRLEASELLSLSGVHERKMRLGANRNVSLSRGSPMLAFVLASLEQAATGRTLRGLPQPPSPTLFAAVFAHDFNIQYLRRILDLHWVVDSYPFDAASPGGSLRFDLSFESHSFDPRRDALDKLRVRAFYSAAPLEAARGARPLVPPFEPPREALVLDQPYMSFRHQALAIIDVHCIPQPLRGTIETLQHPPRAHYPLPRSPFFSFEVLGATALVSLAIGATLSYCLCRKRAPTLGHAGAANAVRLLDAS